MSYTNDDTAGTRGPGAIAAMDLGKTTRPPRSGRGGGSTPPTRAPVPMKHPGTVMTPSGPVVIVQRPPTISGVRPAVVMPAQQIPGTGAVKSYGASPVPRPTISVRPGRRAPLDKRRPGVVVGVYPPPVPVPPSPPKVSPFVNGGARSSSGSGGNFAKGSSEEEIAEIEAPDEEEILPEVETLAVVTKPPMSASTKWLLVLGLGGAVWLLSREDHP